MGASGRQTAADLHRLGLEGVMTLTGQPLAPAAGDRQPRPPLEPQPLGAHGWTPPPEPARAVGDLVAQADMLVLVAADLRQVPGQLAATLADAARDHGGLIAALVVGRGAEEAPDAQPGMTALREAADMVVTVRGPELAAAFLDVLRGGFR